MVQGVWCSVQCSGLRAWDLGVRIYRAVPGTQGAWGGVSPDSEAVHEDLCEWTGFTQPVRVDDLCEWTGFTTCARLVSSIEAARCTTASPSTSVSWFRVEGLGFRV